MTSARLILWFAVIVALSVWTFLLSSCTLTVSSDGSKSVTVDGAAIAKIIAEK